MPVENNNYEPTGIELEGLIEAQEDPEIKEPLGDSNEYGETQDRTVQQVSGGGWESRTREVLNFFSNLGKIAVSGQGAELLAETLRRSY